MNYLETHRVVRIALDQAARNPQVVTRRPRVSTLAALYAGLLAVLAVCAAVFHL